MITTNEITEQYNKLLGRAPTSDELNYFLKFKDDLQGFELGQVLSGLPEYQKTLQASQGKELEGLLGASDQNILNQAADTANSAALKLGRGNTSAIGAQILSAGQNLAQGRQGSLANFYSGGFGELRSNSIGRSEGSLGRAYGLGDERRKFNQDLDLAKYWYDRKQNDYNNYLNQANSKNKKGAIGGLIGGGIGAYFGGPVGAQAGSQIGSTLGSF